MIVLREFIIDANAKINKYTYHLSGYIIKVIDNKEFIKNNVLIIMYFCLLSSIIISLILKKV